MRYSPTVEAVPRTLTRAEFERDWEPKGWNLLHIGPTETWREEWDQWGAVRDIVQNALDEAEAYEWGYENGSLWIADKGKGVSVDDFLLGPPQLKPDWARGKWGEGMKVAVLVFMRMGHSIHVQTKGKEIWLLWEVQRTNGTRETLAALWRYNGARLGTKFTIAGYDGPAYEHRFVVNLPRSLILAKVPSLITHPKLRVNLLIKAEEMASSPAGGVIYARDIYMRDIASIYSYNLWGFDMAPDRHGARNDDDVWVDMGRLWCGIDNEFLMEDLIRMVLDPPQIQTEESRRVNINEAALSINPVTKGPYVDLIVENAAAWQRAWRKVTGPDTVIRTTPRWDGWVKHLGYESVSVSYKVDQPLGQVIKTDAALVDEAGERLQETDVIPDERLTEKALTHLNMARTIAATLGVTRVVAAIIPPASGAVTRTSGLYDYTTESIKIHLEVLEYARKTIDTIIHELGHHRAYKWSNNDITKAEDLTPLHSEKMTEVAAWIVTATAEGRLDDAYKGAVW